MGIRADLVAVTFDPGRVRRGQRWLYSAGANTASDDPDDDRLREEVQDLAALASAGAEVIVLSHQGSCADGSAGDIAHVATGWRSLGLPVRYCPAPWYDAASVGHGPGTITLLANTRLTCDEEACAPALSARFSTLAPRAIIGGFSKSHRANSSNVGIVPHVPCWISRGMVQEMETLEPWSAGDLGVLVLGGRKAEKLTHGLLGLAPRARWVMPGGAVLNTLLHLRGDRVGASAVLELDDPTVGRVRPVIDELGDRLVFPEQLLVAGPGRGWARWKPLGTPVPDAEAIVDVRWSGETLARIGATLEHAPRSLVAGPPGQVPECFRTAASAVSALLAPVREDAMYLGGDTCAELVVTGRSSSGGGAALSYLATGTCRVVNAVRQNHEERNPHGE